MSNDLYFLFLKQLIHCLLALDLSKGSSIQNFLPSPLSFLVLLQRRSIRKCMITLVTFKRFISPTIKKETYYCLLALALTKSSSIPPKPSSLAACPKQQLFHILLHWNQTFQTFQTFASQESNIPNCPNFYFPGLKLSKRLFPRTQTFYLQGSFPSQILQAWLGPSCKHCLHQQGVARPEYNYIYI